MTISSKRRTLAFACFFLGMLAYNVLLAHAEDSAEARNQAAEARLRRDVTYLASDACEGRGPTTKGINLAADYIANEFKKIGLKPGNPDGTYFQTFTIPANVLLATPTLVLKGPQNQVIELKAGVQFDAMGLGTSGIVTDAPVVFAGYGVSSDAQKYDDYDGLDVEGKVVVLLRDLPRAGGTEASAKLRPQAAFGSKLNRAKSKKALAVLFVNDADTAGTGDDILDFSYTALGSGAAQAGLPAFHMRRSVLETMLHGSATAELSDLEKNIDRDWKPQSVELKGWKVSLSMKMEKSKIQLKNVIGVLEGAGPLAKQMVVVGAHYDHLGYGGAGGSMARLKKRAIHHGADDNGSGTTAVLELARRYAALPKREGRRLAFMTFSGEELGLLGSKHYCKEPLFPLEDTSAMLNLDMVGRLKPYKDTQKDNLKIDGANTAKVFGEILEKLNQKYAFNLEKNPQLPAYSDHFSFYQKKVPVLFFWTGLHEDYHRPSDTADKINVAGMRRIVDLSEEVLTQLTTQEKRPEYAKVDVGGSTGVRGNGPRLGVLPVYDADEKDGFLIEGTTSGSPAAKAGLKKGDRIVGLAGKPVKNIQGYMQIMGGLKKGDTIEVGILRDGKPQTVKATLE
jgi:Peptidase family M28/PDZ domain/PA domain